MDQDDPITTYEKKIHATVSAIKSENKDVYVKACCIGCETSKDTCLKDPQIIVLILCADCYNQGNPHWEWETERQIVFTATMLEVTKVKIQYRVCERLFVIWAHSPSRYVNMTELLQRTIRIKHELKIEKTIATFSDEIKEVWESLEEYQLCDIVDAVVPIGNDQYDLAVRDTETAIKRISDLYTIIDAVDKFEGFSDSTERIRQYYLAKESFPPNNDRNERWYKTRLQELEKQRKTALGLSR